MGDSTSTPPPTSEVHYHHQQNQYRQNPRFSVKKDLKESESHAPVVNDESSGNPRFQTKPVTTTPETSTTTTSSTTATSTTTTTTTTLTSSTAAASSTAESTTGAPEIPIAIDIDINIDLGGENIAEQKLDNSQGETKVEESEIYDYEVDDEETFNESVASESKNVSSEPESVNENVNTPELIESMEDEVKNNFDESNNVDNKEYQNDEIPMARGMPGKVEEDDTNIDVKSDDKEDIFNHNQYTEIPIQNAIKENENEDFKENVKSENKEE